RRIEMLMTQFEQRADFEMRIGAADGYEFSGGCRLLQKNAQIAHGGSAETAALVLQTELDSHRLLRCPARGAASFMPHRRRGIVPSAGLVFCGPGSAVQRPVRCTASGTRDPLFKDTAMSGPQAGEGWTITIVVRDYWIVRR